MKPGDRLVCALVETRPAGLNFSDWPLHVTIIPWFRLNDLSDNIAHGLEQALQPVNSFVAKLGAETRFGPHHNRPATLVQQPSPFTDIEQRVRNYFHKKRAWLVDETTKIRRDFRPHVTVQQTGRLQTGDTFTCDRLYIVEQKGNYKEIAGEVLFKK